MTTKISIIICTANKPDSLKETLTSLAAVHVPDTLTGEVIIVDNQPPSSLGVVSAFHLPRLTLHYLAENVPGKSNGLNLALKHALGDVLIFSDDDLRFPSDWIEKLIEPILSGSADAVAGLIKMAPHLERDWMEPFHRSCFAEHTPGRAVTLIGANMAFHRRVLKDVPHFDTDLGPGALGFADDYLFSKQIAKAGYRIVLNSECTVTHHFDEARLSTESLRSSALKSGRSAGYLLHHWERKKLSFLGLRKLKNELELFAVRKFGPRIGSNSEGCSTEELVKLVKRGTFEQLARELGKPPRY